MKRNPDRSSCHGEAGRGLADRSALDSNGPPNLAFPRGQAFEMAVNACYKHVRLALAGCDQFGKIVNRNTYPLAAPAQHVDHLMARDSPDPRARLRLLIEGLPLEVNGEQGFLHDILGVR